MNTSNASDLPEFDAVVRLFSGVSFVDPDLVKDATTSDFLLLEDGQVWDRALLLSHVKPSDRQRENFFSVISVDRLDAVTLINYWNKAVFRAEMAEASRAWLESVLLVRKEAGWKIKQMHSTRIDPGSIPDDVGLISRMLDGPRPNP